ncbi:thioesterase family protein [Demequina sp. NBRC 110056]|uniref:acyl-CoA thioesterase n=1 Tax=Demequina sp. NBRC 110056 TaxID=1570345 RepID=UPI0009FE0DAD|nr:thioesterase family protein [Demequina sp. NBRC 110056]
MSRIHVPVSLRWSDLDAYGHVNNVQLLRLLEEARIRTFWAGSAEPEAPPTAVISAGPGAPTTTLIASQHIDYLAPIPFLREALDVQLWIGRIGGASLEVCYEVCSPTSSDEPVVFARAATTIVLIDTATQRPRRLTEVERAAWSAHLDEPLVFRRR